MHTPRHLLFVARSLLIAIPACLGVSFASANLIANGGFESGDLSGWSGTALSNPFTGVACPGETFAVEGNCYTYLGTIGGTDTLSQAVNTVAGTTYQVSFSLTPDGALPSSFSASFGGQLLYSVVNPPYATPQTYTFRTVATAASSSLSFSFRDDPGFLLLDAVSVVAVPEPGSYALFGIGLVALIVGHRRRRDLNPVTKRVAFTAGE